jgi:hypothetical protein
MESKEKNHIVIYNIYFLIRLTNPAKVFNQYRALKNDVSYRKLSPECSTKANFLLKNKIKKTLFLFSIYFSKLSLMPNMLHQI